MSRGSSLRLQLLMGCWFACACSSEAVPDRSEPANNAPSRATATPVATSTAAAAGAAAPIVPASPSTVPVVTGSAAPATACEVVQLVADPTVPDMMIVLDRSGSMERGGRWQPSVAAVRKITTQLQDRIRFGLMLFPGDGSMTVTSTTPNGSFTISISGGDLCTSGKIDVPIADKNASAIGAKLDTTLPNGGTPTSDSLMKLVNGFAMMDVGPDAMQHPKYVLLVTDGAPTCPNGMGNGDQPNQPDVDLTNTAVEALANAHVKTFVVGYDTATPGNEALASALDGFAQRGGTGDQKHRPVEDEASLTAALESITASIASCTFKLDKAPEHAENVLVTLDGKQLNQDDPNGWHLVDGRTVEIVGGACTAFKSGPHAINATVQCEVVRPI